MDGQQVQPLALTSKLLFDQWKMKDGGKDLTVMRVILEGKEGNDQVVYQYDLVDYFDQEKNVTSWPGQPVIPEQSLPACFWKELFH